MENKNTIWCLFSEANQYYQPENNLESFWFEKPNAEQLKSSGRLTDEAASSLLQRGTFRYSGCTEYRLCEVLENNWL